MASAADSTGAVSAGGSSPEGCELTCGCDMGGRAWNCDDDSASDDDGIKIDMTALFRKVSSRLLPLFFVMVVMCYVDRTSLAFAAIQLNASLNFSPSVYGLGSGLFFLGYSLFQIPSNLLLRRFGGPTWLALIIGAWGLVASAFAVMHTASQFYVLRLLLGATEAGAFPGMWYVLTTFYPPDQTTFPFAVVEAGISLSHVVAAPLAAVCLSMDGLAGLAGWRWLFLLEGLPTLVLAVVMYRWLPRSPESSDFLTPAERRALVQRLEVSDCDGTVANSSTNPAPRGALKCVSSIAGNLAGGGVVKRSKARGLGEGGIGGQHDVGDSAGASDGLGSGVSGQGNAGAAGRAWEAIRPAVTNKYVWYLGAIKFIRDIAAFGIIFWAPTIINSLLQDMRRASSHQALLSSGHDVVVGSVPGDDSSSTGRALLGAVMALPADHGSGVAAVLLTALPFGLAAATGMVLAESSQRHGERILHISMPYIVSGAALTLYSRAASRSPWLGFLALSLGVVGVYSGSGPSLSLVSELATGPGLVVALPLYNSLGTLGGFLGPAIVGWLVQRARISSTIAGGDDTAAAIQGGGFGVSAVLLGSALFLSGVLVLVLGATISRSPAAREKLSAAGPGGGVGNLESEDASERGGARRSLDVEGASDR